MGLERKKQIAENILGNRSIRDKVTRCGKEQWLEAKCQPEEVREVGRDLQA
jgi:hypothetical protein